MSSVDSLNHADLIMTGNSVNQRSTDTINPTYIASVSRIRIRWGREGKSSSGFDFYALFS